MEHGVQEVEELEPIVEGSRGRRLQRQSLAITTETLSVSAAPEIGSSEVAQTTNLARSPRRAFGSSSRRVAPRDEDLIEASRVVALEGGGGVDPASARTRIDHIRSHVSYSAAETSLVWAVQTRVAEE